MLGFPVTEDFAKAAGIGDPVSVPSVGQLGIHTGGPWSVFLPYLYSHNPFRQGVPLGCGSELQKPFTTICGIRLLEVCPKVAVLVGR